MNCTKDIIFRKANPDELAIIWKIIQQSIERRRIDGSEQWQNGYPNESTIKNDLLNNFGYVILVEGEIAVYGALLINDEPAYDQIKGEWLSQGDFVVVHRVAIAEKFAGQGLAKKMFDFIEEFAISKEIFSVKVDTNFDNVAMLKILESKGFTYCGEVFVSGGTRKAFEKVLV